MNIFNFSKQYIDQIGGQYTQYDSNRAVVVVPLTENRFQTILLTIEANKSNSKSRVLLSSKVCEYNASYNLKQLLEQTSNFDYSRFIIDDVFIKVEACCPADAASEEDIKSMIQEVAQQADAYELKLTGKDVN